MTTSPSMQAMVLETAGQPLRLLQVSIPQPGPGQVLVKVHACGICRTDLHILDGELKPPQFPIIPGHQVVGSIVDTGDPHARFKPGTRVGIPWLGYTCGSCRFCMSQRENLCDKARFTGFDIDGGFAEYTAADERFCFPIPEAYPDHQAAPLLCAGLIGYRAFRMTGTAQRIGLYGFGAAAHILAQVARHVGRSVYAFTRPGDMEGQNFARKLGAAWAGNAGDAPPDPLDAAILFAPAGELVPEALRQVTKGGTVVCAGIHMSDIPSFPYAGLWQERVLRSVANLTRDDGIDFLELAPRVPVKTEVTSYSLAEANEALAALRNGAFHGAGVIKVAEA